MKRRIFAVLLLVLVLATLFVGCKKKTTCELCEKKAWCEKVKVGDESGYVCSDCKKKIDALKELLGDLDD